MNPIIRIASYVFIALTASAHVLACPAESNKLEINAPHGVALLNPSFKHYLSNICERLPPLPGPPGSTQIGNCAELIAAIASGVDINERKERKEFGAYSMCIASAVVGTGAGASASRFDLHQAGKQIAAYLDLASVRSSLAPQRPATHYFLSNFQFKSIHVDPYSVKLATDHFRYNFDVLAAGDFRHSGSRELLVRFTDRAIGGSYDSATILILSWPLEQDVIEATDAIDYLRDAKAPTPHADGARPLRQ